MPEDIVARTIVPGRVHRNQPKARPSRKPFREWAKPRPMTPEEAMRRRPANLMRVKRCADCGEVFRPGVPRDARWVDGRWRIFHKDPERCGSGPPPGKSVTLTPTVTQTPEEEKMSAAPEPPVTDDGGPEPEGFAERINREARTEAAAVVADLSRVRFRADQVARVLRALRLPVPEELTGLLNLGAPAEVAPPEPPPAPPAPEPPGSTSPPAPEPPAAETQREPELERAEPEPTPPTPPKPDARVGFRSPPKRDPDQFLDKGPYLTLPRIEGALRELGRDITESRLIEAWGITASQAGRVIRKFYGDGLLIIQSITSENGIGAYGIKGEVPDALDGFPKGSIPWEEMPSWKSRKHKTVSNRIAAAQECAVLARVEERGHAIKTEVEKDLGLPGSRMKTYLDNLENHGILYRSGMRRAKGETHGRTAVEYRPVRVPEEEPEEPKEPEPAPAPAATVTLPVPEDNVLTKVRDWAIRQSDAFQPAAGVEPLQLPLSVVHDALSELARQGILQNEGMAGFPLFRYVPKTEPGAAAKHDAERRPGDGITGIQSSATGTGPSGRLQKPTDPDVAALVSDARKAGCEVGKVSSGHWRVKAPNGRSTQISGTPRNKRTILNDRARIRRLGVRV